MSINEKRDRCKKANELLQCISHCGRKFFNHDDLTSFFEVSDFGRVFFADSGTATRVYTHTERHWYGFSEGGSLRQLVESLRDYIMKDKKLNDGFFNTSLSNGFDHPWGYGEDILLVNEKIKELDIAG